MVAFAAVEGIPFSGSFWALFWLKKRGLMPGPDLLQGAHLPHEGLNADFACPLYGMLEHKLPEDVVHEMIRSTVEVEQRLDDLGHQVRGRSPVDGPGTQQDLQLVQPLRLDGTWESTSAWV